MLWKIANSELHPHGYVRIINAKVRLASSTLDFLVGKTFPEVYNYCHSNKLELVYVRDISDLSVRPREAMRSLNKSPNSQGDLFRLQARSR